MKLEKSAFFRIDFGIKAETVPWNQCVPLGFYLHLQTKCMYVVVAAKGLSSPTIWINKNSNAVVLHFSALCAYTNEVLCQMGMSNFTMGTILGKGFAQAQVHTNHSTSVEGMTHMEHLLRSHLPMFRTLRLQLLWDWDSRTLYSWLLQLIMILLCIMSFNVNKQTLIIIKEDVKWDICP